ncbi:MAG: molybdopterin-dependent oxidoreductase [Candidatus Cloacimonetes bacterium]|nr:molybdopterin-dependent oxidoreductase [Candidatus Cloacimonadota bacterium]
MSRLKELNTPIFWAEGHPGRLKREKWEIKISGTCQNPQVLNWDYLMNMPKTVAEARLTSVTRFSVFGRWGGVKLSDVAEAAGINEETNFVRFWSVGKFYDTSIPLDIAMQERTLLAYEFDDQWLEEDYGGPVRLFCPYLWGYKSAKSVVEVIFSEKYVSGFWEKRGYPDDAYITAGFMRDVNSGFKLRQIPDGEVKRFLDE